MLRGGAGLCGGDSYGADQGENNSQRHSSVLINPIRQNEKKEYTYVSRGALPSQLTYFLAKTDPETYSVDQLERDGQTVWDGVRNPQAVRAIREMKSGDRVFLYHSMGDAAIVGVADITADGRDDPSQPKLAVADFRFRGRIDPPVTLREIKASGLFDDWSLVRQSRLSTMKAPDAFVRWVRSLRPRAAI